MKSIDYDDAPGSVSIKRGCGQRIKGKIYCESGISAGGSPIEAFLFCPPAPLPDGFSLQSRGVVLYPRHTNGQTVWHIFDHIGGDSYPNPSDFVEEMRLFGMSRMIENIDYSKLSPESRHYLIHDKAIDNNWRNIQSAINSGERPKCPKNKPHNDAFCIAFWRYAVERLTDSVDPDDAKHFTNRYPAPNFQPTPARRIMPSFEYYGYNDPETDAEYMPGIIASMPITRITLVKSGDSDRDAEKIQKLQYSGVPFGTSEK